MKKMMFSVGLSIMVSALITMAGCSNGKSDGSASTVEPERISLAEFRDLIDNQADIVIVDTRSLESYEAGHIPGAISLPLSETRDRYQELPQDKTIIFYCS